MFRKNEKVARFTAVTFVFLFMLSFIPEVDLPYFDYTVKKLDLFSDIRVKRESRGVVSALEEGKALLDSVPVTVLNESVQVAQPAVDMTADKLDQKVASKPAKPMLGSATGRVLFEDYSGDSSNLVEMATRLTDLQRGVRKNFRIGFLGDSFIEGDILTERVRTKLQESFGGRGVGFVPVSHVAAKHRSTIKHSFQGWKTYSMIKYKEADRSKLTITGYYFIPEEGANVSYKVNNSNTHKDQFSKVELLFINPGNAKITALVNDSHEHVYYPDSSEELQTITISEEAYAVDFKFESVEGLIVYGAYLNDDAGIYVDNFSMRGSSGMVLSISDDLLSENWRSYKDYDILVLQYGLNVVAKNTMNYSSYKRNMIAVVNRLKRQFPNTVFVVMGIGDRGFLKDGSVCTMPEVFAMIDTQREIAKETNVLFWDTFTAMGGANSIEQFVNSTPPLANKDFIHINKAGGQYIANEFIKSIQSELQN